MWVPYYLIHFYFMLQIKIVQGSVLHVIYSIATIHICACTYSHHNDKLFNFSIRNHHIYIHQNKWQMNVLMIILSGGNGPTLNSWKCQFQFYCSRYHQFRLYFCMNWNCTSKVISSSHVSVRSTISLSFSSQGNTKFAKLSCYLLRMTHTLVSDYCAYNMMSMCFFLYHSLPPDPWECYCVFGISIKYKLCFNKCSNNLLFGQWYSSSQSYT